MERLEQTMPMYTFRATSLRLCFFEFEKDIELYKSGKSVFSR